MQLKNPFPALILGFILIFSGCGKVKPGVVYFVNLRDSQQVESPFVVHMKSENLLVDTVKNPNYFRIIVDSSLTVASQPAPQDTMSVRYGEGQTATLDLPEGEHTLTLQFLNQTQPTQERVFQQIHIRVTKRNPVPVEEDE